MALKWTILPWREMSVTMPARSPWFTFSVKKLSIYARRSDENPASSGFAVGRPWAKPFIVRTRSTARTRHFLIFAFIRPPLGAAGICGSFEVLLDRNPRGMIVLHPALFSHQPGRL